MSETPETDKAKYDSQPGNPMFPNGCFVVPVDVSLKIEKERNEARELVLILRSYVHVDPLVPNGEQAKA